MQCEHYCPENRRCMKGMPIALLYDSLICMGKPGRCPIIHLGPARPIFECTHGGTHMDT